MDISIYFKPVNYSEYDNLPEHVRPRFGHIIEKYSEGNEFPALRKRDIAIIGIDEDRNAINNEGCVFGADRVREYLYELYPGDYKARIVDLGNIKAGNSVEDTYFAATEAISELLERNILPIIIGGGQDFTLSQYRAYEKMEQIINILSVDPEFDLGNDNDPLHSKSYLTHVLINQPSYLFNYTNLGYQTYFVDQEAIRLMDKLYFDTYRLGVIRKDIQEVEPLVRNADLLTFDISAIRASEAPGNKNAGPNGFFGDEACQMAWYAGMSDKLTSFGVYEYNPVEDPKGHTAHLIAQMLWYLIEGYYNRKDDFPNKKKSRHMKFMVQVQGHSDDLVFYKSKETGRWWMEVLCPDNVKSKYERHYIIPCSHKDYEMALKNEIPDRWWQAYQKLM
jgi:arginase family enzyme